MPNESNLWLPSHLRPARKATKIVFWKWNLGNDHYRYTVGFPEQFSRFAPANVQVIVCESAAEVEKYDKILRQQDQDEHEMSEEQREAIEGPILREQRADLYNRLLNAKDEVNRVFLEGAIKRIDDYQSKRREKRESYMHVVAFEDGK